MAEVSRHRVRKVYEAAKHHGIRAFTEAKNAWSNDDHQIYSYLKPYYSGSAADFVQDRVSQASRFYQNQMNCDMNCERDESDFENDSSSSGRESTGQCPPIGSSHNSNSQRRSQQPCASDDECTGRNNKCCATANGRQCVPVSPNRSATTSASRSVFGSNNGRSQSCALKSVYCNKSIAGFSVQQLFEILKVQVKRLVREVNAYVKDTPAAEWIALVPDYEEIRNQVYQSMERHSGPQMRIIKEHLQRMTISEPFESAEALKDMIVRLMESDNGRLSQLAVGSVEIAKDFLSAVVNSIQRRLQSSPTLSSLVDQDTFELIRQNIDAIEIPRLEDVDDVLMSAFGMLKAALLRQIKTVGRVENGKVTVQIPHPFKWNSIKSLPQLKDEHLEYGKKLWTRSFNAYKDFTQSGQLPVEMFGKNNSADFYDIDSESEEQMQTTTELYGGRYGAHKGRSSTTQRSRFGASSDEESDSFRGSQESSRHRGRSTSSTTTPQSRHAGQRNNAQSNDYMSGRKTAQSNYYTSGR